MCKSAEHRLGAMHHRRLAETAHRYHGQHCRAR